MLFIQDEIRTEFLADMQAYCKESQLTPVFASVVGSVSKGLQSPTSDYDTRVLYLEPTKLDKIYLPREHEERALRRRVYPAQEKTYEWIPFWELTSFFQLLSCPSFKDVYSLGLYRIVPWTLFSPYSWDPYGIVQKITPLVNNLYHPHFMITACYNQFKNYYHVDLKDFYSGEKILVHHNWSQHQMPFKIYIHAIYEIVAIHWMLEYNTFHPTYFRSMFSVLSESVLEEIEKLLNRFQVTMNQEIENDSSLSNFELLNHLLVEKSPIIENYIKEIEKRCEVYCTVKETQLDNSDKIQEIYDIISYSMEHESIILNRCKNEK